MIYLIQILVLFLLLLAIIVIAWKYSRKDPYPELKRSKHKGLPFRYFTPENQTDKLPMVIYLHGAAERGSDNLKQINTDALIWIDQQVQEKHPCYVIIPQCPKGKYWVNIERKFPFTHYQQDQIPVNKQTKALLEIIDHFIKNYPVDPSRIYLAGFSMGSAGAWDLITRYPEKFAASINMAGTCDPSKAGKAVSVPIRAFNGAEDEIMPPELNSAMCDAIKKLGGDCELMVFEGVDHVCTDHAYQTPGLFDWLFSQMKKIN
jgi:predicted peptidase